MGLTFFNRERARQAALEKTFLDDVVVEPTSPVVDGEVGTLPQEPAAEVEVKEIEEVKPKRKRK